MRATWKEEDGRWAFGIDSPNAIDLTDDEYQALIKGQSDEGKKISIDENGRPCLMVYSPVAFDPSAAIKAQIIELERQQTPRRVREAVFGADNGWLENLESQIAVLRAQL